MPASAPVRACAVGAELGEGPLWIASQQALWFVDIKAPKVYRFRPETGALDAWDAPAQIGWVLPADDGAFLAGLQTGIHRFDPGSGFSPYIAVELDLPGNRLNDAATDPDGRLWFGSMDNDESAETGRLYRLADGCAEPTSAKPVSITNGPAIAPDGRTLYHVDTLGRVIIAHAIQGDGSLDEGRTIIAFTEGYPDGAICDTEGHIWVGLYGGWSARRYAPDGTLVETVPFPVANVTKIALGGEDLRTAYATTARQGLSAAELAAQPLAGDVFSFRVDTPGIPVTEVRLGH